MSLEPAPGGKDGRVSSSSSWHRPMLSSAAVSSCAGRRRRLRREETRDVRPELLTTGVPQLALATARL